MFKYISLLFFVTILSSCSGKVLTKSDAVPTAVATPPTVVAAKNLDSSEQNKTTKNTPKVDAYDCKMGSENRDLHIDLINTSGCQLWYSNYSKTKPIAWSENGMSHCEKVNLNIRQNLEKIGYVCTPKDANKFKK